MLPDQEWRGPLFRVPITVRCLYLAFIHGPIGVQGWGRCNVGCGDE